MWLRYIVCMYYKFTGLNLVYFVKCHYTVDITITYVRIIKYSNAINTIIILVFFQLKHSTALPHDLLSHD